MKRWLHPTNDRSHALVRTASGDDGDQNRTYAGVPCPEDSATNATLIQAIET
ncbi:MAG: hypothetical protein JOY92_08015 [Verrucomicrobia bacterium]|nr:hypothetical protein [Verrucomicrobiota bacterium]